MPDPLSELEPYQLRSVPSAASISNLLGLGCTCLQKPWGEAFPVEEERGRREWRRRPAQLLRPVKYAWPTPKNSMVLPVLPMRGCLWDQGGVYV